MSPSTRYEFRPDYAMPPGETLRDRLTEIGVSQADLATRSGLSTKHVNQIIQGSAPISQETALILERVTGTPARLWNALESAYREALLRAKQRHISTDDERWLDSLPLRALQSRQRLPQSVDKGQLFEAALAFFGVGNRRAWERIWMRPVASFKRSKAFRSDPGAVAAWLRIGQLEARSIETKPYNAAAFRSALQKIRQLSRQREFAMDMVELCAAAGVAVVFVPEIDRSRISGATWWSHANQAVIALSDRYKHDDNFWFSFFHEAAHVLLHSKKETFIEEDGDNDELEDEASRFAANTLIPPEAASHLPSLLTPTEVERFAEHLEISPGIVVGRLHHDGLWSWNKGNRLRQRLQIVEV